MAIDNSVELAGTVSSEPTVHHESYDRVFYIMTVSSLRQSGTVDLVPVLFARDTALGVADGDWPRVGERVSVIGEIRTYTDMREDGRHLSVMVYGMRIEPHMAQTDINHVRFRGSSKFKPFCRITPQGREIADLLVMVERGYGRINAIPVILWGRNARDAENIAEGERVEVIGRFQSRVYQKAIEDGVTEDRTAYEVSASWVMRA